MIGWLKGQKIELWGKGSKKGLLIQCGHIGYEVQLIPRDHEQIKSEQEITIWIHQVFREDSCVMFGFKEKLERNLFRKLIEINGIGPQIAISLLETYRIDELLLAIKTRDTSKLSKASGIGKRIAERLAIELKDKLDEFDEITPNIELKRNYQQNDPIYQQVQEELEIILKSLNYDAAEINKVLKSLSEDMKTNINPTLSNTSVPIQEDIDRHLKKALILLSQEVASKGT